MPSVAETVFGVAELAEKILLHLDYKQLFAVERVSRKMQSAMQTSKKLRRIMFLEAALCDKRGDTRMILLNPILRDQTLRLPSSKVAFPFACISDGVFHVSCERRDDWRAPWQQFMGQDPPTSGYDSKALPSWRHMRMVANSSTVVVNPGFGFKTGSKETQWDVGAQGHPTLGELADWLDTVPHDEKKPEVVGLSSGKEAYAANKIRAQEVASIHKTIEYIEID